MSDQQTPQSGHRSFALFAALTPSQGIEKLESSSRGLSSEDAKERLNRFGPNSLKAEKVTALTIFLRQFKSTLVYLLVFAAVISYFLGERLDTVTIGVVLLINSVLGFTQEHRSQQAIEKLQNLITKKAKVKRDGRIEIINQDEIVPGDMVVLEEGDVVPADLRLIEVENVEFDESVITGESYPVVKGDKKIEAPSTITEATNCAFTGTTVTGGSAVGIVIETGPRAVIGTIAKLTIETKKPSSFEEYIREFSRFIFKFALITLGIMIIGNIVIKGPNADYIQLFLFSIALIVGIVPEALPVVTTLTFSKGALELAKHKVVVKRLSSLEDLGNIEILCTDKTGTITQNKLTVKSIYGKDKEKTVMMGLLGAGVYDTESRKYTNPFDEAFSLACDKKTKEEAGQYRQIWDRPFDPKIRTNSTVMQNGSVRVMIVRGAPEEVWARCTVAKEEVKRAKEWFSEVGHQGLRVLAVAIKEVSSKREYTVNDEKSLTFVGMCAFYDPIKETTRETVEKANRLGVRLKVLTGDSAEVARTIGLEAGIIKAGDMVVTGDDFAGTAPSDRAELVKKTSIFARVSPEQKYEIIGLLQRDNHVGFLGEGINDAPALKLANVAIAVEGASDVSREAADVILLEKNLKVIVEGIHKGRAIFANIEKYTRITLVSNFGNFFAIAAISTVIDFLPMLPTQILLVNMLSDLPMVSIATDNVDASELKRPQRYNIKELSSLELILGSVSTLFDFIYFGIGLVSRFSPLLFQTLWFIESILSEVFLIFSLRSRKTITKAIRPSTTLLAFSVGAVVLTVIIPLTPLGTLFHFAKPTIGNVVTIVSIVVVYFITTEAVKQMMYRHNE